MTSSNLTAEAGESILEEDEQLGGATSTVQYECSMQELEEAGFHRGFSIRHIDEMPEHESEFIPGPAGQLSGIRDCLAALYRVPPKALLELVEMFDLDWGSAPYDPYTPLP
ncbi:MAG: hypothetical protein ACLP1Q_12990 [Solirubrobacteraceae bacterium]|jgi:hypothetical protein